MYKLCISRRVKLNSTIVLKNLNYVNEEISKKSILNQILLKNTVLSISQITFDKK